MLFSKKLPIDSAVQAEYADGFVLDQTKLNDISPYDPRFSVLRAILNKEPEAEHGALVRFSVFWKGERKDIDWTNMPPNARPVRYMNKRNVINQVRNAEGLWINDGSPMELIDSIGFGYQYTDENGNNQQEITEYN